MSKTRTVHQFKAELQKQDMTPTEWAMKNGFNPHTVHRVLRGSAKALWGEARRVARAANLPVADERAQPKRKAA